MKAYFYCIAVSLCLVRSVEASPSVTITNPPDAAVFGNTDSFTVNTIASTTTGSVTNVQLFDGTNLLRSFTTAPYNFGVAGFTFVLGTHTLTSVAKDSTGLMATSAPVNVTIARYTAEVTNGTFSLFL